MRLDGQKGYFGDADDELDAADVLDPAGHDSSTAQATRKLFEDEENKVPHFAKGPLGPGERPLIQKKGHVHWRRTAVSLVRRTVSLVRAASDTRRRSRGPRALRAYPCSAGPPCSAFTRGIPLSQAPAESHA